MAGTAAALFDIDGTLVDSNYQNTLAWWDALRQYGHTVSLAAIHRSIGMGTESLLDHLLGPERDRSQDEAMATAHQALNARFWPSLTPLPGAPELVREWARRGWTTVLATSPSTRDIEVLREIVGADDAPAAATGADEVVRAKPAPDIVHGALRRVDGDPERSVMIGDTVWDVHAAKQAGVRCIGVMTGGFGRQELVDAGAVEVYEGAAELLRRLDDSVLSKP
jgi:HAD superfamily hydrolase (TIGR01509 family)